MICLVPLPFVTSYLHPDSQTHSVLASASSTGHIALWDLDNDGRLLHIIRGAHDRAVTSIQWVPGQPVLVSAGEDNSIKVGIYLITPTMILML